MTARVVNGRLEFNESVELPEGTLLDVTLSEDEDNIPTVLERYRSVVGIIDCLPEDFAEQHDHYIHGTPKR